MAKQVRSNSSVHVSVPLILVLDLDETLLRPKIPLVPEHARRNLTSIDFEATIDVNGGVQCLVSLRPGLDAFFDWIRERRLNGAIEGPWLFAQGQAPYVEALLAKIDPEGDIFSTRILTKEECTIPKMPGYVLKDLSRLPCETVNGVDAVSRMILVDNNSISALLYPQNVLLVRDWRGDIADDQELARVSTTLDTLLNSTEGPAGHYAKRLAQMTPGHNRFRREIPALRSLVDSKLRDGETPQRRLHQTWTRACKIKQELLGLPVGEY
jgi:TFIIF-interacting CTD phosphatase-like protein